MNNFFYLYIVMKGFVFSTDTLDACGLLKILLSEALLVLGDTQSSQRRRGLQTRGLKCSVARATGG